MRKANESPMRTRCMHQTRLYFLMTIRFQDGFLGGTPRDSPSSEDVKAALITSETAARMTHLHRKLPASVPSRAEKNASIGELCSGETNPLEMLRFVG